MAERGFAVFAERLRSASRCCGTRSAAPPAGGDGGCYLAFSRRPGYYYGAMFLAPQRRTDRGAFFRPAHEAVRSAVAGPRPRACRRGLERRRPRRGHPVTTVSGNGPARRAHLRRCRSPSPERCVDHRGGAALVKNREGLPALKKLAALYVNVCYIRINGGCDGLRLPDGDGRRHGGRSGTMGEGAAFPQRLGSAQWLGIVVSLSRGLRGGYPGHGKKFGDWAPGEAGEFKRWKQEMKAQWRDGRMRVGWRSLRLFFAISPSTITRRGSAAAGGGAAPARR